MSDWKSLLKADPTDWLLEKDNPSVRDSTLTDVLEKSENDTEVKEAKMAIMETGVVPNLLGKQKIEGHWGVPADFYTRSKYKGTVWQFIILAELGADGKDERIRKACEFILLNSQDRESGGFSYRGAEGGGGLYSAVLACLTGNMVWSLIRFGYLDDQRVQHSINWIVTCQRFDDGIKEAPKGWPYDKREKCFGKHTCHMSVVKVLKALAEIPPDKRSEEVRNTIEKKC